MAGNSNEAELKRERRSLIGKIDRRETTILLMHGEVRYLRTRLRIIEDKIAEYNPERKL